MQWSWIACGPLPLHCCESRCSLYVCVFGRVGGGKVVTLEGGQTTSYPAGVMAVVQSPAFGVKATLLEHLANG